MRVGLDRGGESDAAANSDLQPCTFHLLTVCRIRHHQRPQARSSLISGVDTFYLIFAGALVFFMQIGFAMLCAGSIREKNVKNVLLWNLLDSAGGAFGFWATGYAFAYGGAY